MNGPPLPGIDLQRHGAPTAGNSMQKTKVYSPADRHYLTILEEMGAHLKPRNYLEIGTFRGASLACFDCEAIAIDPDFHLQENYRPRSSVTHLYRLESDTFFNRQYLYQLSISTVDVLFIDGLHIFEQALTDFANCERVSSGLSVILVHDCFPQIAEMAQREWNRDGRIVEELRNMWCGDVWKLLYCLEEHRPDLKRAYIDCQPSGLAVFWGLDRDNQVLASRDEAIIRQFRDVSLTDQMLERLTADFPFQPHEKVIDQLVRYREGLPSSETS
jgi:methyltransferase family protein